jgi:hypothetical protein
MVLEAKLNSSDLSNSLCETELLIAKVIAESVVAAMSTVMAAISSNPTLTKVTKKHALSSANYVSAETVEHCWREKSLRCGVLF